jgi:hypothetical protein
MISLIIRLIILILGVLFFIVTPAIPGAVLWWFLKPDMFWEKFAWIVTSMIFYVIILFYIVDFISDIIHKEDSEEKRM